MNPAGQYILRLAEMPPGNHSFKYLIDRSFFNLFESSDIDECRINLDVNLQKFEDMILIGFIFEGTARKNCDRCNDMLDVSLKGKEKIIIKYGAASETTGSDEVIFLPVLHNDFDISKYIFDYMNLALPVSRVHPEGKCNRDVVKKLKELSGTKKGSDASGKIDPRWKDLLNLAIKKN
ncbi:MAG: DUF177 domain-containing protein [Bacteroidetes bacterium]|nr:DUF177 domain-containing protein [Bacteroidota bacterium]